MNWETLSAAQTVGQTFVAKYDGLAGVYFYLSPQATGNGKIKMRLQSGPQEGNDLATSMNTLSIDAVKSSGYYGFFIPAQASSNQKYYYAVLEVIGSGEVQVGTAAGDAYMNGALYQNGMSNDAQAAFKLSYSRRKAIFGLGLEAITWGWVLAVAFFLFLLPGWGLFSLLWPGWGRLSWPEKSGLSAGLSIALYPLLLLLTDILGLHLGAIYAWLPALAGMGMILWRNRKRLNVRAFPRQKRLITPWVDLTFIVLVALIVITRFWSIRSLDMPMWGDSYQHTMIAQLLVDHGGLFTSWLPYAEMSTFTYHFGFHAAVAVFDWITHLDISKAMLWVGQLLNILAIIVLYPLAIKVGRSRWAGVVAVLVAGLLSPMPMYYVNWGRYTQLAGQVILPVIAWVMWNTIIPPSPTRDRESIGMVTICCLTLGGLAVTHYRVLILALIFLVALWIMYARRETISSMLRKTLWVGVGAGLLFLPWFIRVFGGKILNIVAHQLTTPAAQAVEANPQLNGTGNILIYLPSIIWLALPVIVAIGLWRREKELVLVIFWWFGNLLAGNPSWLGLPGSGAITGFAIFIAAYIPAGILVGAAAGWLDDRKIESALPNFKNYNVYPLGFAILLIGAGIWGVPQRLKDVQPSNYSLVTRPDIMAAQWIKENTAPDAHLLVNSFAAYNKSVIVGSDGGWWLPLLARRQTTVPPILYSSEKSPLPDYVNRINALTFEIQANGIQRPEIISQLKDRSIAYLYIGQLQGEVNSGGPLFTSKQLLTDPNFHLVYHQDRVWIFNIVPK